MSMEEHNVRQKLWDRKAILVNLFGQVSCYHSGGPSFPLKSCEVFFLLLPIRYILLIIIVSCALFRQTLKFLVIIWISPF